jgi:hypothetical protein
MHQHDFDTIVAAIADARAADKTKSSLEPSNLPTWQAEDWSTPSVEIHRVRITGTASRRAHFAALRAEKLGQTLPFPDEVYDDYWAEVIRHGKRYFYCVEDTLIECSVADYASVLGHPSLAYFSCAIPLHERIKKVLATENLPSDFHPGKDSWGRRGDKHIVYKIVAAVQATLSSNLFSAGAQETSVKPNQSRALPGLTNQELNIRSTLYKAIEDVLEAEKRYLASA